MESTAVGFGKAFSVAIDVFKKNIALLIGAAFLMAVVSCCCFVLAPAVIVGYYAIALRLIDDDQTRPALGDLFAGFKFFLPALVVWLVCVLVGAALCGVGALATTPLMILALMRMYDTQDTTVFGSLTEVFKYVTSGGWMLLLWVLVAMILGGIGSFVCYVGVLATMPIGALVAAHLYRQAFPKAEVPSASEG